MQAKLHFLIIRISYALKLTFIDPRLISDEKLVDNMKRQLLVSQEKETVEEILNSVRFRYRTTPHVGVRIWVRYRRHLCSRYTTVASEQKTDASEIYLDTHDLPWRPCEIIGPTVTPHASEDLEKDSRRIQCPKSGFTAPLERVAPGAKAVDLGGVCCEAEDSFVPAEEEAAFSTAPVHGRLSLFGETTTHSCVKGLYRRWDLF
ncbi:hypothetical protein ACTXT7_013911 [Hymenolepis weldensis]